MKVNRTMNKVYYKDIKDIKEKDYYSSIGKIYIPWLNKEVEIIIYKVNDKILYHIDEMLEGYHHNPGVFLPLNHEYFTEEDYISYCKKCDYVYKFLEMENKRRKDMIIELYNALKYKDEKIAERAKIEDNILYIDDYSCRAKCSYYMVKKEEVGEYYTFIKTNPYKNDKYMAETFAYDNPPIISNERNLREVVEAIIETINDTND